MGERVVLGAWRGQAGGGAAPQDRRGLVLPQGR